VESAVTNAWAVAITRSMNPVNTVTTYHKNLLMLIPFWFYDAVSAFTVLMFLFLNYNTLKSS